jgi:hypothetical protein
MSLDNTIEQILNVSPKFTKLSLLFQQCILILKMEGLKDHLPTELNQKLFLVDQSKFF